MSELNEAMTLNPFGEEKQQTIRKVSRPIVSVLAAIVALNLLSVSVAQDETDPQSEQSAETLPQSEGERKTEDASEPAGDSEQPEAAEPTEESDTDDVQKVPEDHLVAWHHEFDRAEELAQSRRAPVVVICGAEWCGFCRKLDEEIKFPSMQKELERWIPVHIDVDRYPDVATRLTATGLPSIRVLSPDGRLVASREGFMEADTFAEWLNRQFDVATQKAESKLPRGDNLSTVAVLKVLKELRSRESTVREAAISRLVKVPAIAAAPVVSEFESGGLSEQLALLELLNSWEAPTEGIDPWVPESLTEQRIKGLEDWVLERDFSGPESDSDLLPSQVIEAQRLIRRLRTERGPAAVAIREQLSRMGPRTLILLRSAIDEETDPAVLRMLRMARYRVAGTPELELEWPGGMERLGATDFQERVDAAWQLTGLATKREVPLLMELFSDPVPMVREIALKGLTRVSGSSAGSALVELLDDDDPNVRAAVLKQLAEEPTAELIPRIAEYTQGETDADLIVHAIRFFREIKKAEAVTAMSQLLDHASWRVRAEAADGIYRLLKKSGMDESKKDEELAAAFVKLLDDEDDFVAGIAVRTTYYLKAAHATDKLLEIARTRPTMASITIRELGMHHLYKSGVKPALSQFAAEGTTEVRSAAGVALVRGIDDNYVETVIRLLKDSEDTVRIAVADAVFDRILRLVDSRLDDLPKEEKRLVAENVELTRKDENPSVLSSALALLGNALTGQRNDAQAPVAAEDSEDLTTASRVAEYGEKIDEVINRHRQARDLKPWVYKLEPQLRQMYLATTQQKFAAARSLALLGEENAFRWLLDNTSRDNFSLAVKLFRALNGDEKTRLFESLAAVAETRDERYLLADSLADTYDFRFPELIWNLLREETANARLGAALRRPLEQSYFVSYFYDLDDHPEWQTNRYLEAASQKVENGTIWQQLTALSLLSRKSLSLAVETAEEILKNDDRSVELRAAALQTILCAKEPAIGNALAIEYLAQNNALRDVAVQFLVLDRDAMRFLGGSIPLQHVSSAAVSALEPISVKPPEGLTAEHVQALFESDSERTRNCAAWLALVLGDFDQLPTVLRWYQSTREEAVRRAAFRAIALTDNGESVPLLRQMYHELKEDSFQLEITEFYWTIRTMTGPEVLKLQKEIRADQGDSLIDDSVDSFR